ncbi:saccharopine dehydrogenase [Nocardia sp. 2]|uniref:Saccharopine dehydrogenase n=1 Tax=Nocardia acididurans TaxID=2802282 RepID=A0ABS1M1H8_9NOCA|nr:saccharopine dehydrogenase [Nocardia acididurans]MBL1074196.1 saccharopine dehydrogenase [Nocardia acididurans]
MEQSSSVLIMGGSGQAGAGTAALLRQWYPTLPLTLAGRDLERARRVADELGTADAVTIDLTRAGLGLPADYQPTAVVAAVWDNHLHGLRYALDHAVPYLGISSGMVDTAPEVVAWSQRPGTAPMLIASHYLAGLVVLATMDSARAFDRVDTIRVSSVLDEKDAGGPAAQADLQRLMATTTSGFVRRDGVFTWIDAAAAQAEVTSGDGVTLPGQSIATLDVPSIALATGAPNVRFDFANGESAGRRRGAQGAVEVRIEMRGTDPNGNSRSTTRYFTHPDGQRPLTALGVALGVERLLGLRGAPATPGVHLPESLLDPTHVIARMREVGTVFTDTE